MRSDTHEDVPANCDDGQRAHLRRPVHAHAGLSFAVPYIYFAFVCILLLSTIALQYRTHFLYATFFRARRMHELGIGNRQWRNHSEARAATRYAACHVLWLHAYFVMWT